MGEATRALTGKLTDQHNRHTLKGATPSRRAQVTSRWSGRHLTEAAGLLRRSEVASHTNEILKLEHSAAQRALHFVWTYGGPLALFPVTILILRQESLRLGILDALYWAVILAIILSRYEEARRYGGRTADGQPATRADFRRFVFQVVAGGFAVWGVMHLYGDYFLSQPGGSRTP